VIDELEGEHQLLQAIDPPQKHCTEAAVAAVPPAFVASQNSVGAPQPLSLVLVQANIPLLLQSIRTA